MPRKHKAAPPDLRAIRGDQTQTEFCRTRLGGEMSEPELSRIENGLTPSHRQRIILYRWLGLPLEGWE